MVWQCLLCNIKWKIEKNKIKRKEKLFIHIDTLHSEYECSCMKTIHSDIHSLRILLAIQSVIHSFIHSFIHISYSHSFLGERNNGKSVPYNTKSKTAVNNDVVVVVVNNDVI